MTLFDSFKRGMKKTRDLITGGLNRITASVTAFDETMLDELEALMVQADFGMAASTDILDRLKEKIRGGGSADRAQVTSYLKSIWLEILGSPRFLTVNREAMTVILLVGVNGTGKTTTAGKLCHRFQSQGYKVMLAAADTFRAAAIDQLKHWGNVTQTPVVAHQVGADPASVVYDAISGAKARNADVLIIGGTSLAVYPAAGLIQYYKKDKLVLINKSSTSYDRKANLVINDSLGKVLGSLME